MKNTNKIILNQFPVKLVFILCIIFQNLAFAEINLTGDYYGLQFASSTYNLKANTGNDVSQSWGQIKGKYGVALNEVVSIEGQLGLITRSNSDHGVVSYGGYLRADKDIDKYKFYALMGFGGMYLYDEVVDDQSESGLSYGVGVEIFGSKDLTLTLEYLSIVDKSVDNGDLSFDTIGLGFTYYFSEASFFDKYKIRSIRY